MLNHFFASTGLTPDRVTSPDVFGWAHGIGLSGKQPSAVTVGARIACLSSFYRFLIRMGMATSNPCDALERPRNASSARTWPLRRTGERHRRRGRARLVRLPGQGREAGTARAAAASL